MSKLKKLSVANVSSISNRTLSSKTVGKRNIYSDGNGNYYAKANGKMRKVAPYGSEKQKRPDKRREYFFRNS